MDKDLTSFPVSHKLATRCRFDEDLARWLKDLPSLVEETAERWEIDIGRPFLGDEVSCAWVAPVRQSDGSSAVLKVPMPHMEAQDELAGLRFWNGDGAVKVLRFDEDAGIMLLESCEPGTSLRSLPEQEQDVVIAGLLRRLWKLPTDNDPFRELSVMCDYWAAETLTQSDLWPDPGIVKQGLRLFEELTSTASNRALLATDLHAGNVLAAKREPWLVIDPKPFVGDVCYDATQHLLNCRQRMQADPWSTVDRFCDLAHLDTQRVLLWTFARTAAEGRDAWGDWRFSVAKALATRL